MRVKLYLLEGTVWSDKGTGQASVCPSGESAILVVSSEVDTTLLLEQFLEDGHNWSRQGNTIVTWSVFPVERSVGSSEFAEPALEYALSFQEEQDCVHFWELITHIVPINDGTVSGFNDSQFDPIESTVPFDLPHPSFATLDRIGVILSSLTPTQKPHIARHVLKNDGEWINAMFSLNLLLDQTIPSAASSTATITTTTATSPSQSDSTAAPAETSAASDVDAPTSETPTKMFFIAKLLFLLADVHVIEHLVSDSLIDHIVAVLENDPDVTAKPSFQRFLQESVAFPRQDYISSIFFFQLQLAIQAYRTIL